MKNLFDPRIYPLPIVPEQCFGCDTEGAEWSIRLANEFTGICGLIWPDAKLINLPLKKDCRCLGIATAGVPATAELCIKCAVEYMKKFNELNRVKNKKRRRR